MGQINFDLVYGLPNQSVESFRESLEQVINNLPGVLENGLFVNLAHHVLVGDVVDGVAGVRDLERC